MAYRLTRRHFVTGAAGVAGVAAVGAGAVGAVSTAVADEAAAGNLASGSYEGRSKGRFGDVVVKIQVDEGAIASVEAEGKRETAVIAGSAFKYIPRAIVDGQTLNVDAVAGATITSAAILAAAADCIAQAGGDPAQYEAREQAPSTTALAAGTYTAVAHGHHSDVEVAVVLGDSSIESVEVTQSGETFNLADSALGSVPAWIVDSQSTNVDTVAGATFTSRAIATAVEQCVEQAGGVEAVRGFGARVRNNVWPDAESEMDADVVIVGSGMSGLAAAMGAQDEGADVVLVEKLPFWGGVSQTTNGGYVIPGKDEQSSYDAYYDYGLNLPCGPLGEAEQDEEYPDRALYRYFCDNVWATRKWMRDMGLPNQNPVELESAPMGFVYWPDGFTLGAWGLTYDGFSTPDRVGKNFEIIVNLFLERGGRVLLEQPVEEVLLDDAGAVRGVRTRGKAGAVTINAPAVVLAAGGFGNNNAMVKEYAPAYDGEFNATLCGNTGDGIRMGVEAGGAVYDRQFVVGQYGHTLVTDYEMTHPYEDSLTPIASIFVNSMGLRANSEYPELYTGGASYVDPDPCHRDYYWAVMNTAVFSANPDYAALFEEQYEEGNERFFEADTLSDLARAICISPTILHHTVARYNRFCEQGVDEDFGKLPEYLVPLVEDGKWYAVKCEMVYWATVGGLRINANGGVVNESGEAVKGLYAAGENANGGLYNTHYVGGRMMPLCATMGRLAGRSAAQGL